MKYGYMFSFDPFLHVSDTNSRDNAFAQGVLSENAVWICKLKKENRFAVEHINEQ